MTIGGFFGGLALMTVGFLMVWKRHKFREYFGDLGDLLGYYNISWLGWPFVGIILLVAGFMVMLGLFDLFLTQTLGRVIKPTI